MAETLPVKTLIPWRPRKTRDNAARPPTMKSNFRTNCERPIKILPPRGISRMVPSSKKFLPSPPPQADFKNFNPKLASTVTIRSSSSASTYFKFIGDRTGDSPEIPSFNGHFPNCKSIPRNPSFPRSEK